MKILSKETVKNKTPFLLKLMWDANKESIMLVWDTVKIQCKKLWKKLTEKFVLMK